MSNIVPVSNPNLPSLPPPGIDRAVSYLSNKLIQVGTGHQLPASEAPTEEQRAGLERRAARLDAWLAPTTGDQIQALRDELYALLSTRKGKDPDADDARIITRIYVEDLKDLPLHAVQTACREFRRGEVPGDEGFRPVQGNIRAQAQRHLAKLQRESGRIKAILNAKIVADPRPSAEARKAAADAARRAFHIPEGGLARSEPHRPSPEGEGDLSTLARKIAERSTPEAMRARSATAPPGDDAPEPERAAS